MTAPENPERLWLIFEERWGSVCVKQSNVREDEIRIYREYLSHEQSNHVEAFTQPAEYIRADVAAAEQEAAVTAAERDIAAKYVERFAAQLRELADDAAKGEP